MLSPFPAVCLYCESKPALPGDRYCCEGCRNLARLAGKSQDLSRPEDPALIRHFGRGGGAVVQFECSVEPLACEACLQGLARLPQIFPGLLDLQWKRSDSVLSFQFRKGQEFPAQVFEFLKSLELAPRWRRPGEKSPASNARRAQVLRLGITGALAGNLMLFAIPIYGGLTGSLRTAFEWTQALLFLPVLFWSARPFFRTAWMSLRMKELSLDLPLAAAFLAGSIASYASLAQGGHDLYFDSLAGFLFLILWSRSLLENSLARHLEAPGLDRFFEQPLFRVFEGETARDVLWNEIRAGQEFELRSGDRLPVDGRLLSAAAEFETSWMNGETEPHLRLQGAEVQAGIRLISGPVRVLASGTATETEFARILGQLSNSGEKLRVTTEAHLGTALVLTCFSLIAALFLFFPDLGLAEILRRGVALLIVACPCAVSFAAPLARARAGRLAFRRGFWIRDPQAWAGLLNPRRIAFDKTGTLTGGLLTLAPHSPMVDHHWKRIILSLENVSRHPVAESLRRIWGRMPLLPVQEAREIPGRGVTGVIEGVRYELKSSPSSEETLRVELFRAGQKAIEIELQDAARPGLAGILSALGSKFELFLISGDKNARVSRFAEEFGFPRGHAWGELAPAEKQAKLEEVRPDLYFGDGTNDLPALQKAPVSFAMAGASLEAQAASDILMLNPDLGKLESLFEIARETRNLNRRNFALALVYNVLAGAAALTGFIGPLGAALLMPLASLALLGSTLWGTALLRKWEKQP